MPETVGLSEVMRKRFAREAQAVAKLSHPNIAAVYDATPDYIAMQLVEGCSISDVPRDAPEMIATLMRDAALALQYAHDCGVSRPRWTGRAGRASRSTTPPPT